MDNFALRIQRVRVGRRDRAYQRIIWTDCLRNNFYGLFEQRRLGEEYAPIINVRRRIRYKLGYKFIKFEYLMKFCIFQLKFRDEINYCYCMSA